MNEVMSIRIETSEVVSVTSVGKRVKINDFTVRDFGQRQPDEGRADKARTACNKESGHVVRIWEAGQPGCLSHPPNSNTNESPAILSTELKSPYFTVKTLRICCRNQWLCSLRASC
jgi:hypothetical protein